VQADKIGLGLNLNEAQVLIQSATEKKGDNSLGLNMEEFANLMFSNDNSYNVDLKVLKPLQVDPN